MDRVQIIAIVLAVGILLFLFRPGGEAEPPPPAQTPPGSAASPPESSPGLTPPPPHAGRVKENDATPAAPAASMTQGKSHVIENAEVRIEVSNIGGKVLSIKLKEFDDRKGDEARPVELVTVPPSHGTLVLFLGGGPFEGMASIPFDAVETGERNTVHRIDRQGVRVTRTLALDDAGYGGRLTVRVENQTEQALTPSFQLALYGRDRPASSPDRFLNFSTLVGTDDGVTRKPMGGGDFFACSGGGGSEEFNVGEDEDPVQYVGIDSQYFMTVVLEDDDPIHSTAYAGPISGTADGQVVLSAPLAEIPAGLYLERNYSVYFGPKTREDVDAVDVRLEGAIRVGWEWVRPFVEVFIYLLRWTYSNVVANYGVAIILLTVLVRLVTAPLQHRSMKSMKGFAAIAPEVKELQEKYKEDRAKLQEETMALYKRRGINPVTSIGGGCLPMLIQMPFLIALYFALQSSIELRHAPFMLWIQDLSAPENLTLFGLPFRPLPLMMGVSMIAQQRLMPTSQTADPQQRQMMMWMSVIFIFMFYSFPSGLVLYWFVSNVLAIAQQLITNRSTADAAK